MEGLMLMDKSYTRMLQMIAKKALVDRRYAVEHSSFSDQAAEANHMPGNKEAT